MEYPFTALQAEYIALLAGCTITRAAEVAAAATKVRDALPRYQEAEALIGAPAAMIGAIDYRESDCNPVCGLGQGDPWDKTSTHVPAGCGPFSSWASAAAFYWNYDHMHIGSPWTMPLVCFKAEGWNGFGPREHGRRTGYLWSGTNVYDDGPPGGGKYVADGVWDPNVKDEQIGIIPIILQLVQWEPALAIAGMPAASTAPLPPLTGAPAGVRNAKWIQQSFNKLGAKPPLVVDGSYGRLTARAVRAFQRKHGLTVDGIAGPRTCTAITVAVGS